jgi:hypothetical protein
LLLLLARNLGTAGSESAANHDLCP